MPEKDSFVTIITHFFCQKREGNCKQNHVRTLFNLTSRNHCNAKLAIIISMPRKSIVYTPKNDIQWRQ